MPSAPGEQLLSGVNCLAPGQSATFFHLVGSGNRTSDLSVTGPMLLTITHSQLGKQRLAFSNRNLHPAAIGGAVSMGVPQGSILGPYISMMSLLLRVIL